MCSESPSLWVCVCFFVLYLSQAVLSHSFLPCVPSRSPKKCRWWCLINLIAPWDVEEPGLLGLPCLGWSRPHLLLGGSVSKRTQCTAPGIGASSAVWRRWTAYGLIIKASWWICSPGRGQECQSGYANVELPNCQTAIGPSLRWKMLILKDYPLFLGGFCLLCLAKK